MERIYDIFEIRHAGAIWRDTVTGHEPALARMRELASDSPNEFRLMHLPSKAVIAILYAKDSYSVKDDRSTRERGDDDTGVTKTDGDAAWIPPSHGPSPSTATLNF